MGCTENSKNILPKGELKYLEKYHCWPYDVDLYFVDEVKIDSLFYTYPLSSYFGENTKYKITKWTKYDENDTILWQGMNKTLEQCKCNIKLNNQLSKGSGIYYTYIYQDFKILNGKKKRKYEEFLLLDLVNNRLHIFKDINKIY